jgi:DNA-binding transcriptional ArsR family regulator
MRIKKIWGKQWFKIKSFLNIRAQIPLIIYIFVFLNMITMLTVRELDFDKLETAAIMLKAIAHPLRIAILKNLDGGKKLTVTEIHEMLGIEQSAASHHLGILKDKGVLCSRRDGKNTYYYLKNDLLSQLVECLNRCACE